MYSYHHYNQIIVFTTYIIIMTTYIIMFNNFGILLDFTILILQVWRGTTTPFHMLALIHGIGAFFDLSMLRAMTVSWGFFIVNCIDLTTTVTLTTRDRTTAVLTIISAVRHILIVILTTCYFIALLRPT
jgi:hypothetical protein